MRAGLISWGAVLVGALSVMSLSAAAQNPAGTPSEQAAPSASNVRTVEISPADAEVEAGQELKFTAVGKDATGQPVDEKPATWFARPGDVAVADDVGTITFFGPGRVRVGAVIGGKTGYATVIVKPAPVSLIEVETPAQTVVVGGGLGLRAVVRGANRDPRTDVAVSWSSASPSVATVDPAGVVTGMSVGRTQVEASAGGVRGAVTIDVVRNPVAKLSIEPHSASARTGDVVRFAARALDSEGRPLRQPSITWSVSSEGAFIEPDGGFVAERPGSYIVSLTSGDRAAFASVAVTPRNVARELEVVGRVPPSSGSSGTTPTFPRFPTGLSSMTSPIRPIPRTPIR